MNERIEDLLIQWHKGSIDQKGLEELKAQVDLENLESVLDLSDKFDLKVKPAEKMWEAFEQKLTTQKTSSKFSLKNILIISILGLLVVLTAFYFLNRGTKIQTKSAEKKEYIFADGSKMILSPGSEVTFYPKKWQNKREIQLIGQAYFEVEKGSRFTVDTKNGNIEVLGTAFDVWAYGKQDIEVKCFEGKVRIYSSNKFDETITENQSFVHNNLRENIVEEIQSEISDWLNDSKNYKAISAKLLANELERWYDIPVRVSSGIQNQIFVGRIPTNNLEKALSFIAETMDWGYESLDNEIKFDLK